VSKITFRADDELVERLEAHDASKSEVMRAALRAYLDGPERETDTANQTEETRSPTSEGQTDAAGGTDSELAALVDRALERRLRELLAADSREAGGEPTTDRRDGTTEKRRGRQARSSPVVVEVTPQVARRRHPDAGGRRRTPVAEPGHGVDRVVRRPFDTRRNRRPDADHPVSDTGRATETEHRASGARRPRASDTGRRGVSDAGRTASGGERDTGASDTGDTADGGDERACARCGTRVSDDHVYCPNCGEKAARRLFCDCGDEVRSDWSFCPGCGRRTPAADVLTEQPDDGGGR